ncbi:hypothetical protein [Chroococcidiopsis sp. CCMEE 29]|nr:hypothetical protein [Chroococcidiopsis sp. CCMEE 29]
MSKLNTRSLIVFVLVIGSLSLVAIDPNYRNTFADYVMWHWEVVGR